VEHEVFAVARVLHFFDADGNGAGAAVQFANLQAHPIITASDFTVI